LVAGRDVTDLPPERRGVGMVFQSYALFPHLTARGNVAFGLQMRRVPRQEQTRRVEEMLDRVGLDPAARDRRPGALSGGQQQRVALARALVIEPDLLLLDEPLANLDRRLREQVRGELRQLQRRTGVTTLLVTHDQEEALALADTVGVMARGRLLQTGTPQELYDRPSCPYIARLLGDANLLRVERTGTEELILEGGLRLSPIPASLRAVVPGDIVLLRPGKVVLGSAAGNNEFSAEVIQTSYRGEQTLVALQVGGTRLLSLCRSSERPEAGQTMPLSIGAGSFWLLPQADPSGLVS
jgi:ABC-type Fe3+/spermidine/putrescine transport system ATPase subunit